MADKTIMPSTAVAAKEIDVEKQGSDIKSSDETGASEELYKNRSHVTAHDMSTAASPVVPGDKYAEIGDAVYNKFTPRRKILITAILSFCGFLAPISSTAVLAAVPEVAATFNTNGSIINLSNALYLIFMGLSPLFWGPLSQVYGRRNVWSLSTLGNISF